MKDFQIQAIGLMSGTSLDGLDVCCCTFRRQAGKWSFHIDCAKGYSYPDAMKQILGTGAQTMSALEFITFHSSYGKFLGERVNEFMQEFGVRPDVIASHGHTIFHEPHKRVMYQIGDGAAIAAETRIPTVSDFRRLDIMLGGQGAPLVPIGDRLLFADYNFCLNIGGFSNISFEQDGRRIAFDISPVNYVINHYCRQIGLEFDRDGKIARQGNICQELLDELNRFCEVSETGEGQSFEWRTADRSGRIVVKNPPSQLAVGTLQLFIDRYLASHGGEVDYIHGEDTLEKLCQREDAIGFLLPVMGKDELFRTVQIDGALPRKTFSMGHAHEKRFYLECRKIR